MEKQEKKERKILTENRLVTVNKRECSFEGLASQMENGEDGVYSLITENKNTIFQPKISITKEDLEEIPPLRQLREGIELYEAALKRAAGTKKAYLLKKALIEMRKDQYIIKQAYRKPIQSMGKIPKFAQSYISLQDTSFLRGQEVIVQGISLMDPRVVCTILCNYSKLKQDSYDSFNSDLWYLLQDFDNISDKALKPYPIYYRIVQLKIDKCQNYEIQNILEAEFEKTYSMEYISSLWRNKIPKMIAEAALEDFLTWHYKKNDYPMKRCSRCGELKPAHNQFFSKNKTSRDNLYSICKRCRNKKGDQK